MAPEGHVERLFPMVTSFAVEISTVETFSKLHRQFPAADRRSSWRAVVDLGENLWWESSKTQSAL